MKKIFCVILMIMFFAVPVAASDIAVTVDGKTIEFDAKPYIEENRVMVPFRAVAEALGVRVQWKDNCVLVYSDEKLKMIIRIGDKIVSVGDRYLLMEVPAVIKDGRTYVPLRFFAESLYAEVSWEQNDRTVKIKSGQKPESVSSIMFSNEEYPVLGGRLYVSMPLGSVLQSELLVSQYAEAMNESVTEIKTPKVGNEEYLLSIGDLLYTSVGDLKKDAANLGFTASGEATVKNDGISYIGLYAVEKNEVSRYLIYDGNTLILASFYRESDSAGYQVGKNLSDKIINTLRYGDDETSYRAGTKTLIGITVQLLQDYAFVYRCGIDFDVWYIEKIVPSDSEKSELCIYYGNHPYIDDEKYENAEKRNLLKNQPNF